MIRKLTDLRVHWIDGAPWFEAREMVGLMRQLNTGKITRHIVHGKRRRHYIYGRGYNSKIITLLDQTALIEVWTALTVETPVCTVRVFLAGLVPVSAAV